MANFGPLGGVKITGFISPTDTNDTYAVIDPLYGIDGLRNVTGGTAGLNAIPALRRRAGMIVGINDGANYYKLNASPWGYTIADWSILNLSGATDTFITGMTFNNGTYDLTIHRNDAVDYTQSLSILSGDMVVTGGTYDINTGTVTFTNNSGGTFNVSGFTSGMTDSFTTTAYTVGNEVRFDNNIQGSNYYSVDLNPILTGYSETLAQTLVLGNTTSGTDIIVTAGDRIESSSPSGATIDLDDGGPNRINIANDNINSTEIVLSTGISYFAAKDFAGDTASYIISRGTTHNSAGYGLVMGSNAFDFKGFTSASYLSKAVQLGTQDSTTLFGKTGTVILGGIGITATTDNTVYVPNFNIDVQPANDDALTQVLVRATDGTVKYRNASSFTGATSGSTFTGNTSASCISDLWVSNIHSCSPLHINPLDEGNVYVGGSSGFSLTIGTGGTINAGINVPSSSYALHVGGGSVFVSDGPMAIGSTAPDPTHLFRISTDDGDGNNMTGARIDMSHQTTTGNFSGLQIRKVPSTTSSGTSTLYGVNTTFSPSVTAGNHTFIAGRFRALATSAGGTVTNYGVQIEDGTEGLGKVLIDSTGTGRAHWGTVTISGISSDVFTTGATLNGQTLVFDNNQNLSAYTVDLSPALTATTTFSGLTDTIVNSPSNGDFLIYSGNNVINVTEKDIYFTASTSGQTVFNGVLTSPPINNDKTRMFVNGVKQRYGATHDYVITGGTSVVWVSSKHAIDTIDELEIIYL